MVETITLRLHAAGQRPPRSQGGNCWIYSCGVLEEYVNVCVESWFAVIIRRPFERDCLLVGMNTMNSPGRCAALRYDRPPYVSLSPHSASDTGGTSKGMEPAELISSD